MKKLFITAALLSAMVFSISSCKKDKEEDATPTTTNTPTEEVAGFETFKDYNTSITENPVYGKIIGDFSTKSTKGPLTFSLSSQKPALAFKINTQTGELSVINPKIWDFEINPTLTTIVEITDGITKAQTKVTVTLTNVFDVGELKHGGVVIWIDPTDNTKGKVCALNDAPSGIYKWDQAKTYCDGLTTGGHSDWYLGGRYDYSTFRNDVNKKHAIEAGLVANGGAKFQTKHYWSSTVGNKGATWAWAINFGNGLVSVQTLKKYNVKVRAIRNF